MKIVQISSHINGSVGKIMRTIDKQLQEEGHESYIFYARGGLSSEKNHICINSKAGVYLDALKSRIFDNAGLNSFFATKKIVKKLKQISPDVVHIHCLHGYYINYKTLFRYFQKSGVKVVWTMHDCWAFTGHCCYYTLIGCDKWKTQCRRCENTRSYPKSLIDNSKRNYKKKKKVFTSLSEDRLTIVTPSDWLKNEVKKSFLNTYPIKTIYNGIDLSVYKERKSSNQESYILGVANCWDERKGLDVFLNLAKTTGRKIVLIGLNEAQIKALPKNIIGLQRTDSQEQLIEYYSNCDVLLLPSREENYPTVSLEAQACGAKVVCFDIGGCKETNCGNLYVAKDELNSLQDTLDEAIKREKNPIDFCKLDCKSMATKYIEIYLGVNE